MVLNQPWFKRAHEALVGGQWMLMEAGTYWQDDDPTYPGPHPNAKEKSGWKEFNNGGSVILYTNQIRGFKFDTLRGKLEGG